ncbi:MAG: hypothetical protein ACOX2X_02150 [Peptococcia bacterium]
MSPPISFPIEAIAKELHGVSRPTVENYIRYLESANLIYLSYPVEMSGQKVLKSPAQNLYCRCCDQNAVLMDDDILTVPEEMGKAGGNRCL